MSSIGTVSTDIIHGVPQGLKTRLDTWETPGLDGYGAQTLGRGDADYQIDSVKYIFEDDDDGAGLYLLACEQQQGKIVTIVDDTGGNYAGVLIVHVDTSDRRSCLYLGAQAWRVAVKWRCMQT